MRSGGLKTFIAGNFLLLSTQSMNVFQYCTSARLPLPRTFSFGILQVRRAVLLVEWHGAAFCEYVRFYVTAENMNE